jgi:hypothetical protein
MNKNVIMIVAALLVVVAVGLWVQYSIVKSLKGGAALPVEALKPKKDAGPSTTTKTTTSTTAPAESVGKKVTISAPVHKH